MKIDADKFREELRKAIESGASVVPLVGSGLSIASGIPAGQDFTDYLIYAMFRCFEKKPWDLRNAGWPPLPGQKELEKAQYWYDKESKRLFNPDDPATAAIDSLTREGLGCLGDWRSTLIFLSRLRPQSGKGEDERVIARSPALSVIDAFNVFITRGKRFSMGHKMLAYLAPVMGTRLILTTNFDNLIEQAFTAVRNDLTVFNVSIEGRLPDHRTVRSQPSLIKLHGGMSETRADFSLDEEPSEVDKERFLNYLAPRQRDGGGHEKDGTPGCLLVIGFSGRDRRIVDFIEHALKATEGTSRVKVFWVAYSKHDSDRISAEFCEKYGGEKGSFFVMKTFRPDLLLLELYHDITFCLPPGGLPFSLSHRVPPRPGTVAESPGAELFDKNIYKAEVAKLVESLLAGQRHAQEDRQKAKNKNKEATGQQAHIFAGRFGTSTVAAGVYEELLNLGKKCIWLDLEDFHAAAMVEAQLFKTICNRRGLLELETVTLTPVVDLELHGKDFRLDYGRLINYLKIRAGDWYIFLNGRYGLGTAAGLEEHRWKAPQEKAMNEMVEELEKNGFNVIYLPPMNRQSVPHTQHTHAVKDCFHKEAQEHIVTSTLDWILKGDAEFNDQREAVRHKEQFVFAITLCRQSRHLSLLSSEAAFPIPQRFDGKPGVDYDEWRGDLVRKWADELVETGLLRFKEGGFYSLRTTVRESLKSALLEPENEKNEDRKTCLDKMAAVKQTQTGGRKNRTLKEVEARIHHWIAEWYLKAFRVTRDSGAFVECLHHRYKCLLAAEDAVPQQYLARHCTNYAGKPGEVAWTEEQTGEQFRLQMAKVALGESVKLLRMSRPIIKFEVELTLADTLFKIEPVVKRQILNLEILNKNSRWGSWSEIATPLLNKWNRENEFLLRSIEDEAGIILYRRLGYIDDNVIIAPEKPAVLAASGDMRENAVPLLGKNAEYVAELWKKHFGKALKHVKRNLKECEIDDFVAESLCRGRMDIEELRAYLFRWLATHGNQSLRLRILLQCFILLMEIKVQTAKVSQELWELKREGNPPEDWNELAVIASAFIRMSWHLPPEDVDLQNTFNISVRSIMGLAFAYMGRFFESHRRYEEASAFLANSPTSGEHVTWGILDLRRSESLICEAAWEQSRTDYQAENVNIKILACLDDAWEALERAEREFSGRSRSVWWWGRLSILKLRVFKELNRIDVEKKYLPLADRALTDRADHIHQVLEKGLLLNPRDVLRTARLAEHYLGALSPESSNRTQVEHLLKYLREDLEVIDSEAGDSDREKVIQYAREVIRLLEKRLG